MYEAFTSNESKRLKLLETSWVHRYGLDTLPAFHKQVDVSNDVGNDIDQNPQITEMHGIHDFHSGADFGLKEESEKPDSLVEETFLFNNETTQRPLDNLEAITSGSITNEDLPEMEKLDEVISTDSVHLSREGSKMTPPPLPSLALNPLRRKWLSNQEEDVPKAS